MWNKIIIEFFNFFILIYLFTIHFFTHDFLWLMMINLAVQKKKKKTLWAALVCIKLKQTPATSKVSKQKHYTNLHST